MRQKYDIFPDVIMNRYDNLSSPEQHKSDWAGIHEADVYNTMLPDGLRRIARRKFIKRLNKRIKQVYDILRLPPDTVGRRRIQTQLDPFFALFPKQLAPQAAVGLTAYLSYREYVGEVREENNIFKKCIANLSRSKEDFQPYSFELYLDVAANVVNHRICLTELAYDYGIHEIEACRLYSASQINVRFPTITSIVRNVTLYGDLIHVDRDALHPMSAAVYDDIQSINATYSKLLMEREKGNYLSLGSKWVEDIMEASLWFLPLEDRTLDIKQTEPRSQVYRFLDNDPPKSNLQGQALATPQPPYLFNPNSSRERLSRMFQKPKDLVNQVEDMTEGSLLNRFLTALEKASEISVKGLIYRSDLFEWNPMGLNRGNIQGDIQEGHLLRIRLRQDRPVEGEIYDSPLEPVEDPHQIEKLRAEALPLTEELRNRLYPGILGSPVAERFRTRGSLDPSRLSNAGFSEAVFRRYSLETSHNKGGSPVLALLIDGSGSIGQAQTHMLKLLLTAWLESTMHMNIRIIAGIYNTNSFGSYDHEAKLRWIYHPHKSIAFSKQDALASVAAIPDAGEGAQRDALSLLFIMEEAAKLAQGNMIYLVHMTDCEFGKSFDTDLDVDEEMLETYKALYNEYRERLNATLLQVCGPASTSLEGLLDKVVRIDKDELKDVMGVARKISEHLSQSMQTSDKQREKAV
jgi:hypothetical protein